MYQCAPVLFFIVLVLTFCTSVQCSRVVTSSSYYWSVFLIFYNYILVVWTVIVKLWKMHKRKVCCENTLFNSQLTDFHCFTLPTWAAVVHRCLVGWKKLHFIMLLCYIYNCPRVDQLTLCPWWYIPSVLLQPKYWYVFHEYHIRKSWASVVSAKCMWL
jgi:hypothetical protein